VVEAFEWPRRSDATFTGTPACEDRQLSKDLDVVIELVQETLMETIRKLAEEESGFARVVALGHSPGRRFRGRPAAKYHDWPPAAKSGFAARYDCRAEADGGRGRPGRRQGS
jgi:hypothetical protein